MHWLGGAVMDVLLGDRRSDLDYPAPLCQVLARELHCATGVSLTFTKTQSRIDL